MSVHPKKRRIWFTKKRMELGITQTQLAHKLNVSNRTISNIELGKRNPSGPLAKRLADVMGFDMSMFYEDQNEEEPRSA